MSRARNDRRGYNNSIPSMRAGEGAGAYIHTSEMNMRYKPFR